METFTRDTHGYRRELLVHCYRMLGSIHDAEDLVQETYLRAWRAYADYDPRRASIRTWLYKIATNACLTALDQRSRRALPTGLGGPSLDPAGEIAPALPSASWLQPLPSAESEDPAAVAESRESVRLALVAAFQYLPPRQRAVLILRDVLGWRAAEVADLVGTSTAAVNSALQRARAVIDRIAPGAGQVGSPPAHERVVLERFAAAFENADVAALTELLTADAIWEMPPIPTWFQGRDRIGDLIRLRCEAFTNGGARTILTTANGQPACALYVATGPGAEGPLQAYALMVLTVTGERVSAVVDFHDVGVLPRFGLPLELVGTPLAGR